MNKIIKQETSINLFGIEARAFGVVADDVTGRILNQKICATRYYRENGHDYRIAVELRFDDQCKNGHESFSITATIDEKSGGSFREYMGGCCHDEIVKHFPELAQLIKWHLTSTDGPMHYVANTLYWLGYSGWCDGKTSSPPNLEHARSTAVWSDMPESFVCHPEVRILKQTRDAAAIPARQILESRLAGLLNEFRTAMIDCGFVCPADTVKS